MSIRDRSISPHTLTALTVAALTFAGACAQSPQSPVSPSVVDGATTTNPDGSTLKVSAPAIVSPRGGAQLDTRRPTLTFGNATGRFANVSMQYRLESFNAAGVLLESRLITQGAGGQTTWTPDGDLPFDTVYAWRVRAELESRGGPWSTTESFRTPPQPTVAALPGGPPRSISINEAFAILVRIHNDLRVDLGSRSTRDDRIAFWSAGVAAVHFGHPRFNPQGPDAGWCIKDAGGGRPISDDVIVRCQSRDFWDLIGGVGANGYNWRIVYDGQLPNVQNVYPPPRSALGYLGR